MSITVTIEKLVYGGEGLARTPEGIVLVPDALPGELVQIELDPLRRGVRRARVQRILEANPVRGAAPCPYFSECGGCHHQQASYTQQLEWKHAILLECLERIGKIKVNVPIRTVAAEPWGYRNRIRLHCRKEGSSFAVGFQKATSSELVLLNSCMITAPYLQEKIKALSSGAIAEAFPEGESEIELFAPNEEPRFLATIKSVSPPTANFGAAWKSAHPDCDSVAWVQIPSSRNRGAETLGLRQKTWGSGAITARVGEFHYQVSHQSFFQTNRFLLEKMIDVVLDETSGQRALDLFAGVGFFTLPLSRRFKNVVAVESHHASSKDLQTNAGIAPSQLHVYPVTAEQFIATRAFKQPWDLVLVDPPRHGLSKPLREAVNELRPCRMAYVSCDPTTLARDLSGLAGYRIVSIHLIDLFPQTYHLESIVHLTRQD